MPDLKPQVLLVPQPSSHSWGRRFFAGVVAAAHELGDVQLALCLDDEDPAESIRAHAADGAIVGARTPDGFAASLATGVPIVGVLNVPAGAEPTVVTVTNDDDAVGRLAAEHLLALGHRTFATYVIEDRRAYFKPRIDAFVRTVGAAGFPVHHGPPAAPRARRGGDAVGWEVRTLDWLAALSRPVAVFAPFDYYAYTLVEACRGAGLAVPADVAVVGVDDDDAYCAASRPPLTSVATSAHEIGNRLLRRLHALVRGGPAERTVERVAPRGLVVRGSSSLEAVDDADVRQALTFLRDRLADPLVVDDVVRHVAVSRRSLERRFASKLGRTIRDQLAHVRVEHAARLLVDTDLPLAEIARRSGLAPQPSFQRAFKSATGRTPGAHRAQFRKAG